MQMAFMYTAKGFWNQHVVFIPNSCVEKLDFLYLKKTIRTKDKIKKERSAKNTSKNLNVLQMRECEKWGP